MLAVKKKMKKKVFVLVVGTTGAGKSSLLKLLTGSQDIKVADRKCSESCTKATSFHSSKKKELSDYVFIDTMGVEDTKDVLTDAQILEQAQKVVKDAYSSGEGDSIKILWCIKANDKATPALKFQANFINNFNNNTVVKDDEKEHNRGNVWNSVCIICKQPGTKFEESTQGAVDSAKQIVGKNYNGDNIKKIGYTCVDWLAKDDMGRTLCQQLQDEQRKILRFLYESEVFEMVSNIIINDLKDYQIFFKNSVCEKCGIIGDKKFCAAKCHTKLVLYHRNKPKLGHESDGRIISKHLGEKKMIKYHPGENEPLVHGADHQLKHDLTCGISYSHGQRTHSGSLETDTIYKGDRMELRCSKCNSSNVTRMQCTTGSFIGMFTPYCGSCGDQIGKGTYYHCNNCCTKSSSNHSVMKQQCSRHVGCVQKEVPIYEDKKYWDCCNQRMNSKGCSCQDCDKSINEQGCKATYNCCGKERIIGTNNGCKYYYQCCDKLLDEANRNGLGCRYKCCANRPITMASSNGQGCSSKQDDNFSCCGRNDDGCKKFWSCCNSNKENKGCTFIYTCCNAVCPVKDFEKERKNPPKNCGKKCKKCDKPWGKGNGCEPLKDGVIEHDWKDL